MTNMTKQRIKLNMNLLNVQLGSSPQEGQTLGEKKRTSGYKELFVPPDMSMVTKLLSKPDSPPSLDLGYDSGVEDGGEEEDHDEYDDDDDPFSNVPPKAANTEHTNPDSYAWAIMRLTVLHLAQKNLEALLLTA